MTTFKNRVYQIVKSIPAGKTMSYKEVATLAGSPKAARAVGNILNRNPNPKIIPCHRIIRSDGRLGGYKWRPIRKFKLLQKEKAL